MFGLFSTLYLDGQQVPHLLMEELRNCTAQRVLEYNTEPRVRFSGLAESGSQLRKSPVEIQPLEFSITSLGHHSLQTQLCKFLDGKRCLFHFERQSRRGLPPATGRVWELPPLCTEQQEESKSPVDCRTVARIHGLCLRPSRRGDFA